MYVVITLIVGAVAFLLGFAFGYSYKALGERIKRLEAQLEVEAKPIKKDDEPGSEIINPYDPIQEAMWEAEKLQEKLNPKK